MEDSREKAVRYLKNPYVIAVIVIRIGGYIYMLFNPLIGMILSFIFDMLDWVIFCLGNVPLDIYQDYDKPLDYLEYLFLIPILYNTPIFLPYILFLIWRTIGHIIYHRLHKKQFFILFPNVAEYLAFIYFLDLQLSWDISPMSPLIFGGILIFKLIHEFILHYTEKKEHPTYYWIKSLQKHLLDKKP